MMDPYSSVRFVCRTKLNIRTQQTDSVSQYGHYISWCIYAVTYTETNVFYMLKDVYDCHMYNTILFPIAMMW